MRPKLSTAMMFAGALLAVLGSLPVRAAELQAWVDRTRIEITDTVELAVRWDGDTTSGAEPDFEAAVGSDFEIRSRSQERQYSIVNGRASAYITWRLTLKPRHTGRLEIGAMTLGTARSQAITVEVRPQSEAARRQLQRLAFFETEVSAEQVPVQAQLLYTIRLHYAGGVQLFGELPQAPDIPDAIVQSLGAARPGEVIRDGRRMSVIEQRFAIFPQRTGRIELPPVSVSGSARINGQRRRIEVTSEGHSVEVVSPPPAAASNWLPANDLEIIEAWSEEPPQLEIGRTITRTVIVTARGQVASMLPEQLPLVPAGLRHYPDPPGDREIATADGTVATRTFSAAIVPDERGVAQFEPIEIPWFDIGEGKLKVARLPGRQLAIGGSTAAHAGAPPPTPQPASQPAAPAPLSVPATAQSVPAGEAVPEPTAWMWVALVCAAGWVLTAAAWLLLGRRPLRRRQRSGRPVDTPADVDAALRHLRRACRGQSAAAAHAALARWAAARYGTGTAEGLVRLRREYAGAAALRELEAALYAPARQPFDGSALLAWVESLPQPQAGAPGDEVLPPLYPRTA